MKLKYILAKKLKDAGFPQKLPSVGHSAKGQKYWMHDPSDNDHILIVHDGHFSNALDDEQLTFVPTLSELIEACGSNLHSLRRGTWKGKGNWIASEDVFNTELQCFEPKEPVGVGHTPEDAVAELWLALNKK